MVKYVTAEMGVDNVGKMDKTDAKCILSGETVVNGYPAKFKLTIECNTRLLFEEIGVDSIGSRIDMVLQEPAQTKLVDDDDEDEQSIDEEGSCELCMVMVR